MHNELVFCAISYPTIYQIDRLYLYRVLTKCLSKKNLDICRDLVISYLSANSCTNYTLSETLMNYIFDAWNVWKRCLFSFNEKEICGCNMYTPKYRGITFCYIVIVIRQSMNTLRCKNYIWLWFIMVNIMIWKKTND